MTKIIDSNVLIPGQAIEPLKRAFLSQNIALSILEQALGTNDIKDTAFYPAKDYIKALSLVKAKVGEAVLRKIGTHVIGHAIWPPNVKNIEDALASIDIAYKMNHKPNNSIGSYKFEKVAEKVFKIVCDNPYPCAFDFGIIQGVVNKFAPKSVISHEKDSCREKNDLSCTYSVKTF